MPRSTCKISVKTKSATGVALCPFAHPKWLCGPILGCGLLFVEGIDGFTFALEGLKDGEQLGDLQQIADALGQVRQLDVAARGTRRGEQRDQSSSPPLSM